MLINNHVHIILRTDYLNDDNSGGTTYLLG